MGGGSGKAGDSLVDFMDGGDGDSIADSDEEGTTGPARRAAVKLEENQGAQQTLGAGAATSQCCPCASCPLGCIHRLFWAAAMVKGKQGPQQALGAGRDTLVSLSARVLPG